MANIRRLVELGLAPLLAKEVGAAIDAGSVTPARVRRLAELGMIPRQIAELRNQLATPAMRKAKRWTEIGLAPRLAVELVTQTGGGGGGGSGLYTVAGSRIMTQHDTQFTAAAGSLGQVYQQLLGVASWDGPLGKVGYMNCRNVNGRIGYIANAVPVDAAAFMIVKPADINLTTGIISSARFVPITFNGQVMGSIPTGNNPDAIVLASDAMPIAVQAGDYVFLQTSVLFNAAGEAYAPILVTGANFPDVIPLGERFQQGTTTQAAKVGTIITANTGPTGGPVGATSFAMTGCPDRENSFVFIGDSIGQGSATGRDFYDAGGVYAAFKQAMYSTGGGGRKHFIDCSTFSDAFNKSSPTTFPYANATPSIHFAYKAVFDKFGNAPFRHVACQLGHNDVNSGFAAMQARFNEMYTFFTTTYQTTKWVQFGCSTATTPGNFSFQTNEADQTVNGSFADVAVQWNDFAASGGGGKITGYIPHHLSFQNGLKFKEAGLLSGTLITAVTAASTSVVTLSGQVPRGTLLVFEPGDATNADAGNYIVKSNVANGANWDHQLITVNGFNRTVQKAHTAGAVYKEAPSPDQEHLSPIVHDRTRDFIVANYKATAFA